MTRQENTKKGRGRRFRRRKPLKAPNYDQLVVNMSTFDLTPSQKELLGLGLSFCPSNINPVLISLEIQQHMELSDRCHV